MVLMTLQSERPHDVFIHVTAGKGIIQITLCVLQSCVVLEDQLIF